MATLAGAKGCSSGWNQSCRANRFEGSCFDAPEPGDSKFFKIVSRAVRTASERERERSEVSLKELKREQECGKRELRRHHFREGRGEYLFFSLSKELQILVHQSDLFLELPVTAVRDDRVGYNRGKAKTGGGRGGAATRTTKNHKAKALKGGGGKKRRNLVATCVLVVGMGVCYDGEKSKAS